MRKFFSAIMALSVLLFVSCDKNEGDIGTTGDGVQAKMGLTLSFPTTMTKAANDHDENATESEASVSSITVFIFESDGSHAEGSPANYPNGGEDLDHFFDNEFTSSFNQYTLKDAHLIETTAGAKKIYAAVNLPSTFMIMNENQLKDKQSTLGLVENVTVTTTVSSEISMISKVANVDLKVYDEADDESINDVPLIVERMMSKIAVTRKNATTTYTNTTDGGEFSVTPDAFTVGNIPEKIFPIQKLVSSKLVTPGLEPDGDGNPEPTPPILPEPVAPSLKKVLVDNINESVWDNYAKNAFYVPEHAPSNSRYDATYAVVRAEFTFQSLVEKVENNAIVLKDATGFDGNVLYVVQNSFFTYFCESAELAAAVEDLYPEQGVKISKFHRDVNDVAGGGEKFYAFYYVFINNDKYDDGAGSGPGYHKNDRLALYRNLYYDIIVAGVVGIGAPGNNVPDPGEPGGEDDEPYNPPTEPPVVDPTDPDPVYGEAARLLVEINVKPWVYWAPEVILEPLK